MIFFRFANGQWLVRAAISSQPAGYDRMSAVSDLAKTRIGQLMAPNFAPIADAAVNYGAVGAIIGHEITRNFGDRGVRFDANGNFSDWWSPDDMTCFRDATRKRLAQYSRYEPLAGLYVDGKLALSENIADLVGLNIAYDAYKRLLHGVLTPAIDGLSGDQRFFPRQRTGQPGQAPG
jgi:predicted metalloendopeptidase